MAANSIVGSQVWPKIKLIKAFTVVLDTCKNDGDNSKNKNTSVLTLLPLQVYGDFVKHTRAAISIDPCSILLNFKPIHAFIAVPVKCKIESEPIKMKVLECSDILHSFFKRSMAANSVVGDRNSNSFKLLKLSLLPARMMKIHPKMKH